MRTSKDSHALVLCELSDWRISAILADHRGSAVPPLDRRARIKSAPPRLYSVMAAQTPRVGEAPRPRPISAADGPRRINRPHPGRGASWAAFQTGEMMSAAERPLPERQALVTPPRGLRALLIGSGTTAGTADRVQRASWAAAGSRELVSVPTGGTADGSATIAETCHMDWRGQVRWRIRC